MLYQKNLGTSFTYFWVCRFQRQTSVKIFNVMAHKLGKIASVGFNKSCIVTAGSDRTLKILDFSSGAIIQSLDNIHEGSIRKVIVQENRFIYHM